MPSEVIRRDVSRLTGLPDELQVRILCVMDPASILACREASPQLKETIDNSIEVHYHLELALSGMLDGPRPPGSACTRDRLAALRAYRAAWDAGKHPTHRVDIDLDKQKIRSKSARHIVYHASDPRRHGGPRRLTVYRPPASFCGIDEHKVDLEGLYELDEDYPYPIMGYVDVQEDMLAYIWDDRNCRGRFKCRFSLLGGHRWEPHPAATHPIVYLDTPTFDTSMYPDCIRISGFDDLVVFEFRDRSYRHPQAHYVTIVLNWKTGVIVWYLDLKEKQTLTLLSRTLLAVLDHRTKQPVLHVFSFDPSAPFNVGCSTLQDCTCTLALPSRGVDPRFKLTSASLYGDIARPSSYAYFAPGFKTGSAPLFLRDPDLTPLVIHYYGGLSVRKREYLLIVPPDTLSKWGKEKPTQRPVPWEQWGPQGTRMICLPEPERWWGDPVWAEGFGSCIAVFERKDSKHVVRMYEVHPYASLRPPPSGDGGKAKPPRRPLWMPAENKVRTPKMARKKPPINLEDPLSTTYPVRKTFRVVPRKFQWHERYDGRVRREVAIGHDNFVVYEYQSSDTDFYPDNDRFRYTTITTACNT